MTYCVAMKGQFGVVMAADSAITSNDSPILEHSSFGEKHGRLYGKDTGPFVQESAIKVEVIGECAFTGAGDAIEIYDFLKRLRQSLESGASPFEAFELAARTAPILSRAQVILGYRTVAGPRLATFNANHDCEVVDDVEIASLGSINDAYKELTAACFDTLRERRPSSIQMLVQIIALLQSYGIHDYLIKDGVGGGICGVALDDDGIHWQPDILFVVAHPRFEHVGFVGSFVRDNCWCLFTTFATAGCIVLTSNHRGLSNEALRQEISPLVKEMETKHDDARFDYICVMSSDRHSVTVIEMRGNRNHRLISVEPLPGVETGIGIFWSPHLQEILNKITEPEGYAGEPHDLTLRFFPYYSPEDLTDEFLNSVRCEGLHFTHPGKPS